MKWFKFYGQDFLTDPKILQLDASERACWITLLCYASVNDNGVITFLTEYQLMVSAGLEPVFEEWDRTKGVLEKFKKLGMITIDDNGMITLLNWQKRQETNLSGYERVKRWREKKRNDNANDNDRVDKSRLDKNNTYVESKDSPKGTNMLKEEILKVYGEGAGLEPLENPETKEKAALTADFNQFLEVYKKGHKERIGGDPSRYTYPAVRKNYKKALKLYTAPELLELLPIFFETNFYESTNWSPLTFLGEKVLNQLKNEK